MQKTHYFCDICKEEFNPSQLKQAHLFGKSMDFCEKCNKELIELLTGIIEKKTGGE